jgi:hypothetical protein
MLDVDLKDRSIQVYLTKKEEEKAREYLSGYSEVVAIHITSLTSKNQNWPMENWELLVKEFPNVTFIQLGMSNEEKVPLSLPMLKHFPSYQ